MMGDELRPIMHKRRVQKSRIVSSRTTYDAYLPLTQAYLDAHRFSPARLVRQRNGIRPARWHVTRHQWQDLGRSGKRDAPRTQPGMQRRDRKFRQGRTLPCSALPPGGLHERHGSVHAAEAIGHRGIPQLCVLTACVESRIGHERLSHTLQFSFAGGQSATG